VQTLLAWRQMARLPQAKWLTKPPVLLSI